MNVNNDMPTSFNVVLDSVIVYNDNEYKKTNYTKTKELHTFTLVITVPLKGLKTNLIRLIKSSQSVKVKCASIIRTKYTDEEIEKLVSRKFEYSLEELYKESTTSKKAKNYSVPYLLNLEISDLEELLEATTNVKDMADIEAIIALKKLQK